MRLRSLVIVPLALAAVLRAQEPLNRPVPLLARPPAPSSGENALSLAAAQRAQELGFPALAAQLYRDLLAAPGGDRPGLTLALATALLDDDRPDQADQVLRGLAGPRGSPWHLRAGLAAAAQQRLDVARAELAGVRLDDLPASDRPWFYSLQGATAPAGDGRAAGDAYARARQAATTRLESARFWLAEEQAKLRAGPPGPEVLEETRQRVERFRGSATGHDFASSYAVMLDALNRKPEAIAVLRRELLTFQPAERARADDTRILLALIDGADDGLGRNALVQLLDSGPALRRPLAAEDLQRQRVALQLLARASAAGPARASFRAELDKLIGAPTPHPILEDLLLFRAAWALDSQPREYERAEADAHQLLAQFPGSALKSYASGVLTASAWEQRRYRTAAAAAAAAQSETPAGPDHAKWSLLVAEAWFRGGDFRSAADAYAAALRERPANVAPGELMFQRVESEIEAGALENAERVLDGLATDPAFDAERRWQAEWNLARMLEIAGRTAAAYARINRLLAGAGPAGGLPAELRARMAWLQAQLAFESHESARTLVLAAALQRLTGVPAGLRSEIASTAALLEAQADFALSREPEGVAVLQRLRDDFPRTDAAVYSYIVEANHDAQKDQLLTAQRLLTELAEKFPTSQYAPYALYQAALQAERLGQYRAANELIESLVKIDPHGDLIFYARREQGDILRKLDEYPQAEHAYELLQSDFSQHKDITYALLALAETHYAEASSDSTHVETARSLLEELVDNVGAPVDVRVEAGFILGSLLKDHGESAQAQKVWWRDVVTPFLLNAPAPAAELDGGGRYWMARTLLELGTLDVAAGQLEQAKQAWQLILQAKLPGDTTARESLASLDAPAPKP